MEYKSESYANHSEIILIITLRNINELQEHPMEKPETHNSTALSLFY